MSVRYASILIIGIFAATEAHAVDYNVTVLQDVGGQGSLTTGINDAGQTVGGAFTGRGHSVTFDATSWSSTGAGVLLQGFSQSGSLAEGINNSGQIVGWSYVPGSIAAALWSPNGAVTALQSIGSINEAMAINASGKIAGFSSTTLGALGVLWSTTGSGATLPGPSGMGYSTANGINASGWSVGDSNLQAKLWSPEGAVTALKDIGGQGEDIANAINDSNEVVGWSMTSGGATAVSWSPNGGGKILQTISGQGSSYASAINDLGQIVGFSQTPDGYDSAVLWTSSGKAINLNSILGSNWTNTVATGINEHGQIVGFGDDAQYGLSEGFVLTPSEALAPTPTVAAPELSTWVMMLAGFAGLGFLNYRRGKAASVA